VVGSGCCVGCVFDHQALVTEIVCLSDGGVDTDVSGDSHDDQVLDFSVGEDQVQVSCDERSLSWFVDDDFVLEWSVGL